MTEDRRTLAERVAVPAPARGIGHATAIEQSRAVAEVLAAVERAARDPRDPSRAVQDMERATDLYPLAERAFYAYPRAGEQITGSTIHLARELARVWRNIAYGVVELERNTAAAESQMLAWAWDLESNVRSSTTFLVPHVRDTKRGPVPIVDLRDVYENNANMGARRVREQITAVLPRWFVDIAEQRCRATLAKGPGDGVPFESRVSNAIGLFEQRYGVRREQLVARVGRGVAQWSPVDLANIGILFRSLESGELRVDEVFDAAAATSDAIRSQAARSRKRGEQPPDDVPEPTDEERAAAARAAGEVSGEDEPAGWQQ